MTTVVGKKLGMSHLYDENGVATPITLVQVYDGCISDFKSFDDKDFNHITLSYGSDKKTEKRLNKSVLGFYKKKNLAPHDKMMTIKVDKDQTFEVGAVIDFNQFKEGDLVDVTGTSKGKGFAGAMKRWNFGGLEAAHGVSVSHRSLGGTGNRRREGKVAKGKKMPGQLGNERVTVKNLIVMAVESDDHVLCVKGAIPGSKGSDVIIRTSK